MAAKNISIHFCNFGVQLLKRNTFHELCHGLCCVHLNTLITYLLVDDADCRSESEFLLFTVEKGQKLHRSCKKCCI